ncbi:hypothetical protein SAMN02745134_00356 [Clostridium acidisoli DSM 12555]|uniref:Uncharacterized protein n=2 Tax=Clostridium TaxID=1485 RepID=A0A1W1X0Q7_9CLOT|nr:hypothetical protein SAMN02745134_00356 [Clostridium acidisoli DSM 12555]
MPNIVLIEFNTVEKDFKTKEDALDWIISNQLGRRNLTDFQRVYLRGLQYEREKKKVGGQKGNNNAVKNDVRKNHTSNHITPQKTCERLAEKYKLNPDTIIQDAK